MCMDIKKDHGIVDNGHTMRWCLHYIPWFMLNGCRWFSLLVHTKELMKDFCSRVFILVVCRLVNHRQTHCSTQDLLCQHTI